jgi:hypothetical protein
VHVTVYLSVRDSVSLCASVSMSVRASELVCEYGCARECECVCHCEWLRECECVSV